MAVDITLPIAVRAAGPALFAVLGVTVALLARGQRERIALGAFLGGVGLALVFANLGLAGGGPIFFLFAAAGYLTAIGGALSLVLGAPRETRPAGLALGALAALVAAYIAFALPSAGTLAVHNVYFRSLPDATHEAFLAHGYVASVAQGFLLVAPLYWALRARRAEDVRQPAGLAAGLLVFTGFAAGSDLLSYPNIAALIEPRTAFAITLLTAGAWATLGWRRSSRAAWRVALAALAATLLGMLRVAVTGTDSVLDPIGAVGLARLAGWAIVAITLVHAGWLDTGFVSRHRTGVAAGALAALFVVAQVAQEFLSAQYGLLMGGIVAGALLFVASPVQRAMERIVEPRRAEERAVPVQGPARAHHEDVYRNALRVALRDRRLTREEEVHLHRVAEGLGIGAGRAHELLVEVERELAR